MTFAMETLTRQHQDVLARMDVLEGELISGQAADLEGFVRYLQAEVVQHFAIEEHALFPVLARHLSSDQGPLAVMHAEHADFRDLLGRIADALRVADVDQQRVCAQQLIELLRAHIAKEDRVLFPMAARLLSSAEQDEVDARAHTLMLSES